jgi:hypothetical protein
MIELGEAIYYKLVQNKDTVVTTPRIPGLKLSDFIGDGTGHPGYRIYFSYEDVVKNKVYPCMVIKSRVVRDSQMTNGFIAMVWAYLLTTSDTAIISAVSGKPREQLKRFYNLLDYWLPEYDSEQNDLDSVENAGNLIVGDKYSVASFMVEDFDPDGFNETFSEYQATVRWMARLVRQ